MGAITRTSSFLFYHNYAVKFSSDKISCTCTKALTSISVGPDPFYLFVIWCQWWQLCRHYLQTFHSPPMKCPVKQQTITKIMILLFEDHRGSGGPRIVTVTVLILSATENVMFPIVISIRMLVCMLQLCVSEP